MSTSSVIPVLSFTHDKKLEQRNLIVMNITSDRTIGSIVAEDYRAAATLTRYGIDFCCKGGRTVEEVCRTKEIDRSMLENEIRQGLTRDAGSGEYYTQWSLSRLVDHIENIHHSYVVARTSVLREYLAKLCKVHGGRHPELFEIAAEFDACAHAMAAHMKKEELLLFPFIKQLEKARAEGMPTPHPHFGTVSNPIAAMMHDHDAEGERFRRIKELSCGYAEPADGCATYHTAMAMLQDFEADLHLHIHMENNNLFPRAVALENDLRAHQQPV